MFASSKRFSVQGSMLRSVPVSSLRTGTPVKTSAPWSSRTDDMRAETASGMFGGGMLMSPSNSSTNVYASGPLSSTTLLNSLVPEYESYLRRFYRDIYYTDAVAGTAVDLMSTFPFSDYTLTGCSPAVLDKYQESLNRINIRSLMPEISTAYLVDGTAIASFIFNSKEKIFIDLLLHSVDNCNVETIPFYSQDPSIVVTNTRDMIDFMNSNNPAAIAFRKILPDHLRTVFKSDQYVLDPLTTLYLARKTLPGSEPISFLKRVLPIYILEKTLYRGTVVEANKRQRSMLHVQMGDDLHSYTPEEMAETVNQFQMADLDPLGAIIGTRNDVQASELRQGGDFWKWTDTIEQLVPYKLRALGISEAFLSGDANFSNVETALSVFMENEDAYRAHLTYETFTNKVFPVIAISNGFYKPGKAPASSSRTGVTYQTNNTADLEIPSLHWHKKLEARNEDNIMDTLEKLTEKGFPIPLRMWAAAGKIDINSYLHDLQNDKDLRKQIADIAGLDETKLGAAAGGRDDGLDDMGDDGGYEFSGLRRKNMLDRDFGDASEVRASSKTGKDKWVYNQSGANKDMNWKIAKSMAALKDPHVKHQALKKVKARLGGIPNIVGVPSRTKS